MKHRIRIVDFKRDKNRHPGRVAAIEYDPGRSAYHGSYILCGRRETVLLSPVGLGVNDVINTGKVQSSSW